MGEGESAEARATQQPASSGMDICVCSIVSPISEHL